MQVTRSYPTTITNYLTAIESSILERNLSHTPVPPEIEPQASVDGHLSISIRQIGIFMEGIQDLFQARDSPQGMRLAPGPVLWYTNFSREVLRETNLALQLHITVSV